MYAEQRPSVLLGQCECSEIVSANETGWGNANKLSTFPFVPSIVIVAFPTTKEGELGAFLGNITDPLEPDGDIFTTTFRELGEIAMDQTKHLVLMSHGLVTKDGHAVTRENLKDLIVAQFGAVGIAGNGVQVLDLGDDSILSTVEIDCFVGSIEYGARVVQNRHLAGV